MQATCIDPYREVHNGWLQYALSVCRWDCPYAGSPAAACRAGFFNRPAVDYPEWLHSAAGRAGQGLDRAGAGAALFAARPMASCCHPGQLCFLRKPNGTRRQLY